MPLLYLTSTAISDLTIFIFAAFIAVNLWSFGFRLAIEHHSPATFWLAGAFSGASILLSFLEHSLYPDLGFYVGPLNSTAVSLGLVSWVQFAYYFPAPLSENSREARFLLWT